MKSLRDFVERDAATFVGRILQLVGQLRMRICGGRTIFTVKRSCEIVM